jgi:hypothetical protein
MRRQPQSRCVSACGRSRMHAGARTRFCAWPMQPAVANHSRWATAPNSASSRQRKDRAAPRWYGGTGTAGSARPSAMAVAVEMLTALTAVATARWRRRGGAPPVLWGEALLQMSALRWGSVHEPCHLMSRTAHRRGGGRRRSAATLALRADRQRVASVYYFDLFVYACVSQATFSCGLAVRRRPRDPVQPGQGHGLHHSVLADQKAGAA